MLTAIRIFYSLAFLLYAVAAGAYVRAFSRRTGISRRRRLSPLHYGMLIQCLGLVMYTIYLRQAPFSGMFQGFTFAAFVLALLFVLIFRAVEDDRSVGIIVLPLAALFSLIGIFTPLATITDPSLAPSPWFLIHVSTALFSYGAFGISFATAVLYLLLHREIKSKRLGRIFERLPALGELDHLTYLAITIGFIALTVSIAFGILWTRIRLGRMLQLDLKEIITFADWLIYALYLHSRVYRGWQGKRSAWLAIFGFAVVLFNFAAVTVLFSRTHAYL
jgi:cytochrome c-type biogenesis protein CcsB